MLIRKIGYIIRGGATPTQLLLACLLGAWLGFMPGFAQAGGLILLFTLALILLNVNLKLAGLVGVVAKLASLALLPISFAVGTWLLDGPLAGLFRTLINAPVLALFGFEYYATTGGLVMGLAFGLGCGWGVVRLITTYRRQMVSLEKGSPRFNEFTAKKWVKMLTYLLFGAGPGPTSYEVMLHKKVGKLVRPLGVVFVLALTLLLVVLQGFAREPIVTMVLQRSLERANRATVDLGSAELNLKTGRLVLRDLAMADPQALDTDLLRAVRLEGEIHQADLLRKRLHLNRLVVEDAVHGAPRAVPGRLTGKPSAPKQDREFEWPDARTLEDYFRKAREWKDRLAQLREWMEKISGPPAEEPEVGSEPQESLRERLWREAQEKGYAWVRASHLVDQVPTITVSQLRAEKVRISQFPEETLDVVAENLSTHPRLLERPPRFAIRSSGDTLGFETGLGGVAAGRGENHLQFHYRGLPVAAVMKDWAVAGQAPLEGGTIDLAASGTWRALGGVFVDFPLELTLHHTTLHLPQARSTPVENFRLPVAVRGPLENPRIRLEEGDLMKSLAQAGVSEAKARLVEEAGQRLGGELDKRLSEPARGLLEGLRRPNP